MGNDGGGQEQSVYSRQTAITMVHKGHLHYENDYTYLNEWLRTELAIPNSFSLS